MHISVLTHPLSHSHTVCTQTTPSHMYPHTPSHVQGEVTPTGAKHWSVAQFMTPDKVTACHHDSSHAQTQPSREEIHNVGLHGDC